MMRENSSQSPFPQHDFSRTFIMLCPPHGSLDMSLFLPLLAMSWMPLSPDSWDLGFHLHLVFPSPNCLELPSCFWNTVPYCSCLRPLHKAVPLFWVLTSVLLRIWSSQPRIPPTYFTLSSWYLLCIWLHHAFVQKDCNGQVLVFSAPLNCQFLEVRQTFCSLWLPIGQHSDLPINVSASINVPLFPWVDSIMLLENKDNTHFKWTAGLQDQKNLMTLAETIWQ